MALEGIICPIITPMHRSGRIIEESVRMLVENLIRGGCHGVMVAGTTGEFPYLSDPQWTSLVKIAGTAIDRRITMVVNVTHPVLSVVIERTRWAAECGADYVACIAPGYFPLTPQEIVGYYDRVSRQASLPVIIYNIPQRSAIDVIPVVAELAAMDNMAGMKDSSGDWRRLATVSSTLPEQFHILLGTDFLHESFGVPRATGIVPALANVLPELYGAWWKHRHSDSRPYSDQVRKFSSLYDLAQGSSGYIEVLRAALERQGIAVGDPLFPALPISAKAHHALRKIVISQDG